MSIDNLGVSVIIPAKNEEEFIGCCIDSVLSQDYSGPFEVLVVDNNSTDNTYNIAFSKGVDVYTTNVKSPSAVRNFGAQKAKHQILAFIDGDCTAPVLWIKNGVQTLLGNSNLGAVGGPCNSPATGNWIVKSWAPNFKLTGKFKCTALPGGNLMIWKSIFDSLGGFDESLISAEDDDICRRVIAAGFDLMSDYESSVTHHGYPDSLTAVFAKSVWHGSTQLRAHGLIGDKLVLMTLVWTLNVILLMWFIATNSSFLMACHFLIFLIIPSGLMYTRLKNTTPMYKFKYFIPCYFICLIAIAGRSVGLLRELTNYIVGKNNLKC